MKRTLCLVTLTVALVALPFASIAAFEYSTPGVSGYDLVSFHTGEKPQRGNGNHKATHDGVDYLFVNEANKKTFERNPERYLPAYGGYCAYGVSVKKKFVGDPDVWRIVDGRLYLNLDTKIQNTWSKDIKGNIRKSEANWPKIEHADPAAL